MWQQVIYFGMAVTSELHSQRSYEQNKFGKCLLCSEKKLYPHPVPKNTQKLKYS
jgi:hypothetical protein